MKHSYFIFVFSCSLLLLLGYNTTQAQPWKGGINFRPHTTAINLRCAVSRSVALAHHPLRPIRMRVLSVPVLHTKVPAFPLVSHPREMYRGLALDAQGKELRTILKNGMPVETSHFPIWLGAYDGKAYRSDTPALFATTNPQLASTYALRNRFRTDGPLFLPVVLHLKRVGKDIMSGEERTVEVPHDIPVSWIYKVSTLLRVEGKLRWGELKLDGEAAFLFFPYPTP